MYDIKFLESIKNIKLFTKNKLGREPNTRKAQEISSCLIQGRLFFEAAKNSPLEIKPLQLYYGLMAFSKAVVLLKTTQYLENLKHSHGLSCILNNKLCTSKALVKNAGTFIEFNDVISALDGVNYYIGTQSTIKKLPSSCSNRLKNKEINIKEIFSRLPSLNEIYFNTFNEVPKNIGIYINNQDEKIVLQIDEEFNSLSDKESLINLLNNMRKKYPFLTKWCLSEAFTSWGNVRLLFENIEKGDIDELLLPENYSTENKEVVFKLSKTIGSLNRFEFTKKIAALTGTLLNSHQNITEEFNGEHISELSLYYLASFILSSIARYKPDVWIRAITHSAVGTESVDDAMLAMIEKFMDNALSSIPKMVVTVFELTYKP